MHLPRVFLSATFAFIAAASLHGASTPITPVPFPAQARVASVQVRVAPDHRDWTYKLGEHALFRVTVTADNEPVEGATISYQVGPEMMAAPTRVAAVPAEGLVVDGGTMDKPGFLRLIATTEVAGRTSRGLATAAFSPEKITPTQVEPPDFEDFWKAGREELAAVPIEPRIVLLPEACTDKVNVYHVSFRTVGPNWTPAVSRIYGILCEPKAPGKYPALLRVPGAGIRPYSGDKGFAVKGMITLEIGVHGIPVNLSQDIYDQLYAGPLSYYWLSSLDRRELYYFRRIYLSCLRANDFLTQREMWDGKNLLVAGASQGGQLTLVTAGLDSRVTGIAVTHPAFCDVTGDLHGRAGGWPRPFARDLTTGAASPEATPARIATTGYYDAVNFARRIKVPGYYTWGYNDEICPPTSIFAAYNTITAPKQLGLTLELGHTYTPEQGEAINAWITTFLGLK